MRDYDDELSCACQKVFEISCREGAQGGFTGRGFQPSHWPLSRATASSGGDLHEYISRWGALHEDQIRHIMSQLAQGMKALRAHNISHRDLKPSNILLCGTRHDEYPTVKIADLGQACPLDAAYGPNLRTHDQEPRGPATRRCGSPPFAAPETEFDPYWAECDLWSLGMILYIMLLGRDPYLGDSYSELMYNVKNEKIELPDHVREELTPGCRKLLHGLLQLDPAKRLTFDQFFDHPFFQGRDESAGMVDDDGEYDGEYNDTFAVASAEEHYDSTCSGSEDVNATIIAAAADNNCDCDDETVKTNAATVGEAGDDGNDGNDPLVAASTASGDLIIACATCAAAAANAASSDNRVPAAVSTSAAAVSEYSDDMVSATTAAVASGDDSGSDDTVLVALALASANDMSDDAISSNMGVAVGTTTASQMYSICCYSNGSSNISSSSSCSAGSTSAAALKEMIFRVAAGLHPAHGVLKRLEALSSQAPGYGCKSGRRLLGTATAPVSCCLWLHKIGLILMGGRRVAGTAQSPNCQEHRGEASELGPVLVLHSWSVLMVLYRHLYDRTAATTVDLKPAADAALHRHHHHLTILRVAEALVDFAVHHSHIATYLNLLLNSACTAEEYGKEANVLLFGMSLSSAAAPQLEHHLQPQSTACGRQWKVPTATLQPPPAQQAYRSRLAVSAGDMRLRQSVLNPGAMPPASAGASTAASAGALAAMAVAVAAEPHSLQVTPLVVSGAVPGEVPAQGQWRNPTSNQRSWWQWACGWLTRIGMSI
ncbi:hypothetical protein VaNZ11_011443 [Volvox africanus]|uniref:Protein kinase domain-containing protein n=1 Tax=Volvox africanus TaxID=51714 RepID=A0ABQ5SBH9_9CHLO|nr:hypothetical protein VaNZ11_011443 [Volvox africanus]